MGPDMSMRVRVHIALPLARVPVADDMPYLSGENDEFSVRLQSIPGGAAALWDSQNPGYDGQYRGASQTYPAEVAQEILAAGHQLTVEAFYVAFIDGTDIPVPGQYHNLPEPPADSTYAAFMGGVGVERVHP